MRVSLVKSKPKVRGALVTHQAEKWVRDSSTFMLLATSSMSG